MRYVRRHPSRRAIANNIKAATALYTGQPLEQIEPERAPVKRGPQKESKTNEAVKDWARMRRGVLYRNSRGFVQLPSGHKARMGIGPNGMGDLIGYLSVTITPAMVGRTVAVFAMVESKRAPGVTASGNKDYGGRFDNDEQTQRIEEVRDAGGIAGYARSAVDAEVMLATWSTRKP